MSDGQVAAIPANDDEKKPLAPVTGTALEQYLRLYDVYRSYVVHEGDLINARLMWILTIPGFYTQLLATRCKRKWILSVTRARMHIFRF